MSKLDELLSRSRVPGGNVVLQHRPDVLNRRWFGRPRRPPFEHVDGRSPLGHPAPGLDRCVRFVAILLQLPGTVVLGVDVLKDPGSPPSNSSMRSHVFLGFFVNMRLRSTVKVVIGTFALFVGTSAK